MGRELDFAVPVVLRALAWTKKGLAGGRFRFGLVFRLARAKARTCERRRRVELLHLVTIAFVLGRRQLLCR